MGHPVVSCSPTPNIPFHRRSLSNPFTEIPAGTKKCCQACFQRISRKIGQMSSGANSPASSNTADGAAGKSAPADGSDSKGDKGGLKAAWADGEVEAMKAELRAHGRNWAALAGKIGSKTADQCKKFFYENRKKCGLDKIILEYKRVSPANEKCCMSWMAA